MSAFPQVDEGGRGIKVWGIALQRYRSFLDYLENTEPYHIHTNSYGEDEEREKCAGGSMKLNQIGKNETDNNSFYVCGTMCL